jgi:hypothetical protein
MSEMRIRTAERGDLARITEIYRYLRILRSGGEFADRSVRATQAGGYSSCFVN